MPIFEEITKEFLSHLGWTVKGGDKDKDPADVFTALGVSFDLKDMTAPSPTLRVVNTQGRIDNIVASIEEILKKGFMTSLDAARLAGKLVFARSQIFGRVGSLALRALHRRASALVPREGIDSETLWALHWWKATLPDAEPRVVCLAGYRQPLIIFTDGCCDPNESSESGVDAGYGGIMFDPEDNAYEYFRMDMSEELKQFLTIQGQKAQIVGQAEVLPCLLARKLWADRMKHRAVLYFIDNDAARYGFIRGMSNDPHMSVMLTSFWEEERMSPSYPWFARVPSGGNPADNPSRGEPPCVLCQKSNKPIKPVEVFLDPMVEVEVLAMWYDRVEFTI